MQRYEPWVCRRSLHETGDDLQVVGYPTLPLSTDGHTFVATTGSDLSTCPRRSSARCAPTCDPAERDYVNPMAVKVSYSNIQTPVYGAKKQQAPAPAPDPLTALMYALANKSQRFAAF